MVKEKSLNKAFFITVGISTLIFTYLIFLGYEDIKSLKDVIKITASVLFPLPMLFFVRFLIIQHFIPKNSDEYKLQNQRPATILLISTLLLGVALFKISEWASGERLEDHLVYAHLINSTTIGSYVLNYLLYNNLRANGILSGVLLALAVHVFFLS